MPQKKTKADASTFCRYPVKPVNGEYIATNVDVQHTDECPEVFIKCGLAERNATHENGSMDELQGAQWQYPKGRNDKLTPMSPDNFLLTNSQKNILISDQTNRTFSSTSELNSRVMTSLHKL